MNSLIQTFPPSLKAREGVKKLSNGKTGEPKQQERLFPPRFQFFHSFSGGKGNMLSPQGSGTSPKISGALQARWMEEEEGR